MKEIRMVEKKCETTPKEVGYRAEKIEQIDSFLKELMVEKQYQAAGYLMARHGKTFVCKSMGKLCGYEDRGDFQPDTIRRVASVTKTFTATAIMKLLEDGKIHLYQPISDIINEFNNDMYRDVNIFHLLTHTSGISPDPNVYFEPYPRLTNWWDNEDWIKKVLEGPIHFAPGTQWAYCSKGFAILGEIIQRVSGMPYDEYIMKNIVKPLGMDRTFFFVPEEYHNEVGIVEKAELEELKGIREQIKNTARLAGGGLFSTMEDLAIFGHMLMNYGEYNGVRILSRKAVDAMTKNQLGEGVPNYCYGCKGIKSKYGLGFVVDAQNLLSKGSFLHEGAGRCGFCVDRSEGLLSIYIEVLENNFWDWDGVVGLRNIMWSGLE